MNISICTAICIKKHNPEKLCTVACVVAYIYIVN